MIRLQRILVPYDFSTYSEHALRYGCELAGKFRAELHLLFVVENVGAALADPEMAIFPVNDFLADQERYAAGKLKSLPGPPWTERLTCVRSVRTGAPFLEIIRHAREMNLDLIVMGTHGRTGLKHVLLGSVAERVVRKAGCPVLTVRHPEHDFIAP